MMFDVHCLRGFLVRAKKATYASGNLVAKVVEADKSTTLYFLDGDWQYHDNYFGGEPYGGREVVFYKGRPVYLMAYYGCVDRSIASPGEIYGFLQKALLTIPESNPYRGSEEYSWNDFVYLNRFEGEIGNFNGVEVINFRGLEAYQARYMGGFVDV